MYLYTRKYTFNNIVLRVLELSNKISFEHHHLRRTYSVSFITNCQKHHSVVNLDVNSSFHNVSKKSLTVNWDSNTCDSLSLINCINSILL